MEKCMRNLKNRVLGFISALVVIPNYFHPMRNSIPIADGPLFMIRQRWKM